jgi:hypothetical protein
MIIYNEAEVPEQIVSLSAPTTAGQPCCDGYFFRIQFFKKRTPGKTKNKAFMPSGMVSAMCF